MRTASDLWKILSSLLMVICSRKHFTSGVGDVSLYTSAIFVLSCPMRMLAVWVLPHFSPPYVSQCCSILNKVRRDPITNQWAAVCLLHHAAIRCAGWLVLVMWWYRKGSIDMLQLITLDWGNVSFRCRI
ncbi:hypothetical protein DFH29DRAFT_939057 [Suillus ampliporus]|nr:hypothetical protein DFH29DRAFT_939057 [Suillus ampliporus]